MHFNYVVTGGCGFIGVNFVKFLKHVEPNASICVIDKITQQSNSVSLIEDLATIYKIDIRDSEHIFKENTIDYVVHFAAESHVDRSISSPRPFVDSNIIGTFDLLEFIRLHQPNARFHHVSTDEVYGSINDGKFSESSTYSPSSVYSSSKASSDMLVISYIKTYGLKASISNCCNNYGRFQNEEKLIPRYIKCLKSKTPLPLFNKGLNIREWIHVADHNRLIYDILKTSYYEKFNVGSNEELSNIELLKKIHKKAFFMKKDIVTRFDSTIDMSVSDRLGHDLRYAIDSSYLDNKIGIDLYNDVDSSIGDLIEHYWC